MPVLRADPRAVREGAAAGGHPDRGLPARHDRDGEPDAHAEGRRRRGGAAARRNPLSTQDDVAAALVERVRHRRPSRSRARTTTSTTSTSRRRSTTSRTSRWTTAPTWSACSTRSAPRAARRRDRRHRGDHHRRDPAAGDERDGELAFPVVAVNDADDQAPVRQPLRHGPVDARRHHPRHERPARRQDVRGRRLRLVRPRRRDRARAGMGAHVDRHRGRPDARRSRP